MAKKKRTPSFIYELRLLPDEWQKDIINHKINTGRQIYNACLGEALKRLNLIRESVLYKKTLKEYQLAKKNKDELLKKVLQEIFSELAKSFKLTNSDIESFAIKFRHSQFDNFTDAHSTQKIATRVFQAVQQ